MPKFKLYNMVKLAAIFLLSTSLFIYEILITRLFSTLLVYHFVFLTTSIAILGIGLGGLIIFKSKREYEYDQLALLLSVFYLISILIIYKLPYIGFVTFYSIISSIPFILGGMILALAFKKEVNISNKLYFADLLGSTFGSISIIPFMDNLGFMTTLFIVSFTAITSSFLFGLAFNRKKLKVIQLLIGFIIGVLLIQNKALIRLEQEFTSYMTSPTTAIDYVRKNENEKVKIIYTKWDSISRTDVIEESKDEKTIITDGGASAPMIKFNGDLNNLQNLKKEMNYLPFTLGKNDNSLLLGSGGGKDVLFALLGGSKNIDAVEINPSTIEAVNQFKDFNGDIYNYEGVNLYIDDGRNFIEKSQKKYDNIYLAMVMTNAVSNGGLSLSENYIYTKDAFKTYFEHLNENGYLSLMFHGTYDTLKGINTATEVLLDMGVKKEDISNYFVAINSVRTDTIGEHKNMISMPVIVFKKNPFTFEEIQKFYQEVIRQKRVIMNIPGIVYMDIYDSFSKGEIELQSIYKEFPLNVTPATDDKPFFYYSDKGVPAVLSLLLVIMIVITLVLYGWLKYKAVLRNGLYFGALGVGFMMIEVPLVQKSILFLGNPAKSFSYILFALLLSCGIGSYFSNNKIFNNSIRKRKIIFLLIPIISTILQIFLPVIIENYRALNDIVKLLMLLALLFPLGFFMGMAFPQGITKMKRQGKNDFIPIMWGVNGIMSVTGSVLSLAVSMTLGFTVTMIVGALIYLLVFVFKI